MKLVSQAFDIIDITIYFIRCPYSRSLASRDDLKRIVLQLEDICSDSLSHQLSGIF